MTSITPEERHEVAKRLRNLTPSKHVHPDYTPWYTDICSAIGGKKDPWLGISALAERLADLIEPMYEPDPEWVAWVESLEDGDVVDRFAYDLIVHGGDMGPNGNKYEGIDEGLVLTGQLFDKFKADFKAEIEAIEPDGIGAPYCPHCCGARVVKP